MDSTTIASLVTTGLIVLIIALIIVIEVIKLCIAMRKKPPVTGENQPLLTPTSQTLQNIEDKLNLLLSGLGVGKGLAPRFPVETFNYVYQDKDGQKSESTSNSSRS